MEINLRDTISLTRTTREINKAITTFEDERDNWTAAGFFYFIQRAQSDYFTVASSIFARCNGVFAPFLVRLFNGHFVILNLKYVQPLRGPVVRVGFVHIDNGQLFIRRAGLCDIVYHFYQNQPLHTSTSFYTATIHVDIIFLNSEYERINLRCVVGHRSGLGYFIRFGLIPWSIHQVLS